MTRSSCFHLLSIHRMLTFFNGLFGEAFSKMPFISHRKIEYKQFKYSLEGNT